MRGQMASMGDFGYNVSLVTPGGYEISTGRDFTVHTATGDIRISPANGYPGPEEDRLREAVKQEIRSTTVDESGGLTVAFADGARLRIEPDEDYEAWTVTGPKGFMVVCMPGGELAIWSAKDET